MTQINVIAVGTRMPQWVTQGFQDYTQRLPAELRVNLIEIASKKRMKSTNLLKLTVEEGSLIVAAIPANSWVVALERTGQMIDSHTLAKKLYDWQNDRKSISFLIGGPEGLSSQCCQRADIIWSLSALTLPHPLVRIVLVEQLYRAYSILHNHPYHR